MDKMDKKNRIRRTALGINWDNIVKRIYIQQIYQHQRNVYVLKLSNKKFLLLNIGVGVEYYDTLPDDFKLLSGDAVNGFGKCIRSHLRDGRILCALACADYDNTFILSCYKKGNVVSMKVDCFGKGQAIITNNATGSIVGSWAGSKIVRPLRRDDVDWSLGLEDVLRIRIDVLNRSSSDSIPSTLVKKQKKRKRRVGCVFTNVQKQFESQERKYNETIGFAQEAEIKGDWTNVKSLYIKAKEYGRKMERARVVRESIQDSVENREKTKEKTVLSFVNKRYHKFRYAWSPNNILILGSKNESQVNDLLRNHFTNQHTYLHAEVHGAPSVIMNTVGAMPVDYEFAADCAALWSNKYPCSVAMVDEISLSAPSGLYLSTGSVVLRGKRISYPTRNPQAMVTIRGDVSCVEVITGPYNQHIAKMSLYYKKYIKLKGFAKQLKREIGSKYTNRSIDGVLEKIRL